MSEFDFDTPGGSTSTFPRPTSLFQPERFTPSLLDSSSYSPFPTVAGSRRDPFGLDAYLLHPGAQIWGPLDQSINQDQSGISEKQPQEDKSRMGGLKKMKSSTLLKKSSPLSQSSTVLSPPPPTTLALPLPEQSGPRRRRSQSLSSTSSSIKAEIKEEVSTAKTGSVGKKGFGRLFGRRKSISSIPPPPVPVAEILPPVPSLAPAFTPSSSSTSLSTPPPGLDSGSTSSSSSSLAPRTPRDSPSQSTDSLTEALAKAEIGEEGTVKKKGLMGWLGRRTSKMPPLSTSANSSPISSPNPSLTNLTAPTTPPISTDPVSRVNPSPEQQPYAWVGDQLRRASYRKLAQLRRPSPHPLAQQLRRQTSHLPNEVASSFEVGQILYPRSINPRDPHSGLTPAQRGLWCLLAVKIVLDQLDTGSVPAGTITKRPILPHNTSERKPRGGMKDFINRPPFEDRYLVFYPEETWSPVSMARPGFGVWDLDFSKYILALAESGEVESTPWPNLPRPSFLAIEGLGSERAEVVEEERAVVEITEDGEMFGSTDPARTTKAASIDSNTSDDSAATAASSVIINTPSVLDGSQTIPEIKIDFDESDLATRSEGREVESFRRPKARVTQQTWEESDEDEEDVRPLRSIGVSRHLPQSTSGMKVSTSVPNVRETTKVHTRRSSQPIPSITQLPSSSSTYLSKRRSQFDTSYTEEERQQRAMDEVAKARERRQALHSGEVDRKAEGEIRRKEEAKRRSIATAAPVIRPQSTGGKRSSGLVPSTSGEDQRQRTKSFGPETSSSRSGLGQTKRYHSFYEVPTHPSPSTSSPSMNQMYNPNLNQQYYPHPGMVHSNSMGNFMPTMSPQNMPFYPQPMVHPQMYYPSPMQFGYPLPQPHPSQMYSNMPIIHPGMPNSHSSMSLSDQQRRARQRASYA